MTKVAKWLYNCQFNPDLAATADFAHDISYRIQGFTMVYLPAERPLYTNAAVEELYALGFKPSSTYMGHYVKPSSAYMCTSAATEEAQIKPYRGDPRVVACYAPLLKQLLGVGPYSKACYLVKPYLQRAHPDLCGFANPMPPRQMTDDEVRHYLLVDQMDKSLGLSDGFIFALLQGKWLTRSRLHEHAQRDLIKLVKQVARKERDNMRDICESYGYPASPLGDTLKQLDSFYTA